MSLTLHHLDLDVYLIRTMMNPQKTFPVARIFHFGPSVLHVYIGPVANPHSE